jgi:Arc/MetJ family transcription regulator
MAVTSVDVDAAMLRQAKVDYGVRTNREAINLALREAVQRHRQLDAIDSIAAMTIEPDARKVEGGEQG